MSSRYLLTASPIDERAACEILDIAGAGGVVTFVGRVRGFSRGSGVTLLEYEAFGEMAERVFADIGADAKSRFAIADIVIHHRVGALHPGDVSVVIAVAAEHRDAAFDACRFAIDTLKQIAPIWKKEHTTGGAVWVEERP